MELSERRLDGSNVEEGDVVPSVELSSDCDGNVPTSVSESDEGSEE